MTRSPLATREIPAHNKFASRHGTPVTRVIVHHWAGTNGGIEHLSNPKANVSANYLILSDGTLVAQVDEKFRAWTTGSPGVDNGSITVEVQNSKAGGNWPVSGKAYGMLVRLVADVAKRYGWGGVAQRNVRGHREFVATACPGPYLFTRLDDIKAAANAIINKVSNPKPPENPPVSGKSITVLADEVMAGLHGTGPARKKSLGSLYEKVQAEVNRRLGLGKSPAVKTPTKSVAQLADETMNGVYGSGEVRKKKLGDRYDEVQKEINRRLGLGAHKGGPDIAALANAVLRGKYGNGPERKQRLGKNYDAVQAEVNRRLRS